MIKKGDEIIVDVIELNSEGKGVSKCGEDGFVIFTANTLPGDKALVKISRKKSNYAEANLIEISEKSPFRIMPLCKYFGTCGGCKIQNYDYYKQLEFKTTVVRNALERIGGFKGISVPNAMGQEDIFYYRNKMEFSFSDDEWHIIPPESILQKEEDSGFALGLHVPKFHSKIIDIKECFLQSKLSNDILNFTRDFFKSGNIPVYSTRTQTGFLRFLVIRQSKNTNDLMVNLITYRHDKELMKEYAANLNERFAGITTIINSVTSKKSQVAIGDEVYVISGKGFITEKLKSPSGKEFVFKISPQSFFQTNTLQAEKLFEVMTKLAEFSKTDKVLDLYCGAGSISIFISDLVENVHGVELGSDAVSDAIKNAMINKVNNVSFECSDIKDYLEKQNQFGNFNKLILDPPRSGLHPKICEILSESNFGKIIYVSCNPHTQARDLEIILKKNKYVIENIQPVDMFPHTYHVENIVSLKNIK